MFADFLPPQKKRKEENDFMITHYLNTITYRNDDLRPY